jgi:hypothetical protein
MLAAEDDFEVAGNKVRAGAFIIPNADMTKLGASLKEYGLKGWAVATAPTVPTHEMKVPRIGYVHSWSRTQDEGWVRAALDYYGVPFTYFADQKLKEGNLRAKYDVIVFPHTGAALQGMLAGVAMTGKDPVPYKKSDVTPNLGGIDESEDIRGGMGFEGLSELAKFVQSGGTLITEGSTASAMAESGMTEVTLEHPAQLFARGTILRGVFTDMKSPIAYGYSEKDLPVYFNQDPVLNVVGGGGGRGGGRGGATGEPNGGLGQTVTVNATPVAISPYGSSPALPPEPPLGGAGPVAGQTAAPAGGRGGGRGGAGGGGGRGGGRGGAAAAEAPRPRVIMQFPASTADMLLSGTLAGGEALANRALAVDAPVGKGHIVMFAMRPFWRWQSQGTYFLAFNAILNWDHLDAGKTAAPAAPVAGQ